MVCIKNYIQIKSCIADSVNDVKIKSLEEVTNNNWLNLCHFLTTELDIASSRTSNIYEYWNICNITREFLILSTLFNRKHRVIQRILSLH